MSVYADTLLMAAKGAAASGVYAQVLGAPAAYVTRDDIAATAAGILTTPGHVGITYHATGPASIRQKDVTDAIAKASGKAVEFKEISAEEQAKGWEAAGLPAMLVSGLAGFQAALRAGAFDLVTGDVGRLAGKPAESVESYLKRSLA
jgi:NAD(P)H dehydrogenase (quinone)